MREPSGVRSSSILFGSFNWLVIDHPESLFAFGVIILLLWLSLYLVLPPYRDKLDSVDDLIWYSGTGPRFTVRHPVRLVAGDVGANSRLITVITQQAFTVPLTLTVVADEQYFHLLGRDAVSPVTTVFTKTNTPIEYPFSIQHGNTEAAYGSGKATLAITISESTKDSSLTPGYAAVAFDIELERANERFVREIRDQGIGGGSLVSLLSIALGLFGFAYKRVQQSVAVRDRYGHLQRLLDSRNWEDACGVRQEIVEKFNVAFLEKAESHLLKQMSSLCEFFDNDGNPERQRQAVQQLSHVMYSWAWNFISELAASYYDVEIRRCAIQALAQRTEISSSNQLLALLDDPETRIRQTALDAIAQLTDLHNQAVRKLVAYATEGGEKCTMGIQGLTVLGKGNSGGAIQALIDLLDYPSLSQFARDSLSEIGRTGLTFIHEAVLKPQTDLAIRMDLVQVLGRIRHSSSRAVIEQLSNSQETPTVLRRSVQLALRELRQGAG